jgi:hypothetical protein
MAIMNLRKIVGDDGSLIVALNGSPRIAVQSDFCVAKMDRVARDVRRHRSADSNEKMG